MAGEAEISRMIVRLIGDGSSYEAMLKKAESATAKSVAKIGRELQSIGRSMSAVGRQLTLRVTLPIIAFGIASSVAFASFDKAMVESTSIMQVTTQQMEEMRALAQDLSFSGEALQGATDLAQAYFFLASAGKDAAQSMALLGPVSDFATAGAFSMSQATDLLTDAQSALGQTSKDVAQDMKNLVNISDTLVKANTLANASVEQFSKALTTKAGATLKAFNIDLNEGVALLAAYADQGIKAELAGNAVDRLLRLLAKAAADNADEFDRMNIKVFDSQGEFRAFAAIVGDLEKALGDMSTQEKIAALETLGFEARIQQVILPLIGSSEALAKYSDQLLNVSGVTKDVAGKQMEAFANQMKVVSNQIKVVAADIGETLTPAVIFLGEKLTALLKTWRELPSIIKTTAIVLAVLLALLGPVLIGVGTLLTAVGGLTILLPVILPALGLGLIVLVKMAIVIGLVVAGIAAVVAIIKGLQAIRRNEVENLRNLSVPELEKRLKEEAGAQVPGRAQRTRLLGEGGRMGLGTPDRFGVGGVDASGGGFGVGQGKANVAFREAQAKQAEAAQKAGETMVASLNDQSVSFGMTARQADIFALSLKGVSEETLAAAKASDKMLTKQEKAADLNAEVTAAMKQQRDEVLKLNFSLTDFDLRLKDFADRGADPFDLEKMRFDQNLIESNRIAKQLQSQQRFTPRASIQAAGAGSAEAQARIIAFRSTGPEVSAAETTADQVTLIREILERIEAGETGQEILSAGLN